MAVLDRRWYSLTLIVVLFALLLRYSFCATADRFVVVRDNAFVADEPNVPMLIDRRQSSLAEELYRGRGNAFVRNHQPEDTPFAATTIASTQRVIPLSVTKLSQFAVLSRPELIPRATTLPYHEMGTTSS